MEFKKSWSIACVIALVFILCIGGSIMPESSEAQDSKDKSDVIASTMRLTVSQNGKEIKDTIDPEGTFDVNLQFSFPIIRDDLIGTDASDGIDKESQQVNEGDYANFTLGKNFKATEATGNSIAVYIKAPGHSDDGKQIGTITLEEKEDGTVNAKMTFKDPKGTFNYESNRRKNIKVKFKGTFKAEKEQSSDPGSNEPTITILGKKYKVPEVEERIKYDFSKSGVLDDEVTKETITWKCIAKKSSNTRKTTLAGETFTDNLSKVGKYIQGTLRINGEVVNDKSIYNDETKTITYVFPKEFGKDTAEITFQTEVPDKDNTKTVTNEAKLKTPIEEEKVAKSTVQIHHPLGIKKDLKEININKETGEKELIWTIVAGAPNENYGPAWIGDIIKGSLKGQKPPTRLDLSYEHSLNGKEGTWETVPDANVEIVGDPSTFPKFPQGDVTTCPNLSGYNSEIYELGKNWHKPANPSTENDEYKDIESHWFFVRELSGLYRITVKMVYDKDIEVGPIKNDAELHICSDTVSPKEPPIYSGIGTISKSAEKDKDKAVINQGILPWTVSVDFSNVFPSDKRFVYECFYYGSKDKFEEEKENLHTENEDVISGNVLKHLIAGESGSTYFNFNQAYVEGSLKSKKADEKNPGQEGNQPGEDPNGGEETQEPEPLSEEIIPIFNENNEKVGEIVKIKEFSEVKKYTFSIKTRVQNIIENLKNDPKGTDYKTYQNTAVLAVGEDKTFKTIPATDMYQLPVNLLNKFAMERDTDLNNMDDVSKNGWISDSGESLTDIPQINDLKTFNYKDRTVLFRIDINPQGLDFEKYISNLSGKKPEENFTNLDVQDELQEGLTLQPVEEGGPDYYIYEADSAAPAFRESSYLKSFLPPGKALKKIDNPKEAGVSFDKKNMKWSFTNYKGKSYFIIIRAKVNEDTFKEMMKKVPQGDSVKFKNKASLNVGGSKLAEATDYASARTNVLSKYTPDVNGDKLEWTFQYKPFDIKFKNVYITDQLDKNIGLPIDKKGNILLENFIVRRSNKLQPDGSYDDFHRVKVVSESPKNGEIAVKYDVSKHRMYFTIPDVPEGVAPYAYEFEYSTILRPTDLAANIIENTVEVKADGEKLGAKGYAEIRTQHYAAFASIKDFPYFVIKKVDSKGNPLEGAVFQYVNNNNEEIHSLSGEDGLIFIVKMKEGVNEIKEISAPEGYIGLKKPIKININKGVAKVIAPKKMTGKGTLNNPLIVENKNINEIDINVTKRWVGDNVEKRPDSIIVKLIKNGKLTDISLELNKENQWKGSFKNLPLKDANGKDIKYNISENKVEGYTSKIKGNQIKGFVITNTKPEKPDKSGNKKTKNPQTGDNSHIYIWGTLIFISALGLIYTRRRFN